MRMRRITLNKMLLLVPVMVLFAVKGYSQLWANVGKPGFSANASYLNSMAVGPDGTPYVAYQDAANGYAVTVMKYNGTNWTGLGSAGFSPSDIMSLAFTVNSADTAYVAFIDYASSKVSVMKYKGANWVNVGASYFTDSAVDVSMASGANDTLYIAYTDVSDSSKVTVMKFNGTSWVNVGAAGFSPAADEVSLAVDKTTNTPYVAYSDADSGDEVTVVNYSAGVWNTVGAPRFSAADGHYLSLAVNNSGIPVIAYRDGAYSGSATVMQYTLGNWNNIGSPGFSPGGAYYTSLALDSAGTPFVAFQDAANYNALSVMEYTAGNWIYVGSPGCTLSTADYTGLAIDRHGRLYVGFEDGSKSYYASVVMFQHCNTGAPVITTSANGNDTVCPGTGPFLTATGAASYIWSTGDTTSATHPVLSGSNSVYTLYVTGIAANGCAASDSIKVYTHSKPPPVSVSGKDTICKGDTTTLSASGGLTYYWNNGQTTSVVSVNPLVTTTYYVAGADADGCADTAFTKIIVNNGPALTFTGQDTVCKGDSTTLTVGGGFTYLWQPDSSTKNSITVTPSSTETFTVTSVGFNGCKSLDSVTVVVKVCTGIDEVNFTQKFNLSPNPARNYIFFTTYTSLQNAGLILYNINGQLIKQAYMGNLSPGERYKFNLNGLSAGIYYMRLTANEGTVIYKVIKE